MARYLITAEGYRANPDNDKRLKDHLKGKGVKITSTRQDQLFTNEALIVVSCDTKVGANKVQKVLWNEFYCGSVEIAKLPAKGYGGHRMGAEIAY